YNKKNLSRILVNNQNSIHNFSLSIMRSFHLYSILVDRDHYGFVKNNYNVGNRTDAFTAYYRQDERVRTDIYNPTSNTFTGSTNNTNSKPFSVLTYSPFFRGYIGGLLIADD